MAAPSYTTDLVDWIIDSDTTAWGELTNAIAGGAPDEADTESALQGTNTVSQSTNTTGLCSMARVLGSPVTFSSGQVALVWHGHGVATALQTYANNGLRVAFVGSTLGDWKSYTVAGSNVAPFPYGKWVNSAVDPTLTADATNGTPPTGGTSIYGIGSMCQQTAVIAKGQPHVCDIIRYGRAEARINGGDLANGYATFAGFAAQNDTSTNRWGLLQATSGGYLWKGLLTLGYTSAVDFRDSNVNLFVQDCRKVSSTFNKVEIRQASSRVDWTGVSIANTSPSTNASRGSLEVIDNADVNFETCSFTDMGTFGFLSNSTVNGTTFRRCNLITTGGATMSGCTFDKTNDAAKAVIASSPANAALISNSTFISGGTKHGLEIGGTAANITLNNLTWSGYAASDGSTGNEAIYVNIATGSMNLTISGGTTPSVRTAGCAVTVISGAVSATVRAATEAGSPISGANVHIEATAGGPFPAGASVTITNSGTTATVGHTGHALATNDKVVIRGASLDANNGVFTITVSGPNEYTYTMGSAPGSNPTGTITSTFVVLNGTTDVNGEITMSRVFPSSQPVTGRARKSSSAPYYKQGAVTGSVSNTTGAFFTAVLISDD